MTTDHGGSIPHARITAYTAHNDAQTTASVEGHGARTACMVPKTLKAPDWRSLPRYERCHDTITEGDAIGVLLSNRPVRVWVDQPDYQHLITTHGAVRWRWHEKLGSVVLRDRPHHYVSVARLVIGEQAKGFVQYRDEDRLNLRRANLSVDATKRPKRDGLSKVRAEKAAQRKREVEERRALRAKKAASRTSDVRDLPHGVEKRSQKRASSGPTVRQLPPPPLLSARPQPTQVQCGSVMGCSRVVRPVVQGVKRGGA